MNIDECNLYARTGLPCGKPTVQWICSYPSGKLLTRCKHHRIDEMLFETPLTRDEAIIHMVLDS